MLPKLLKTCQSFPAIDNHAHSLLSSSNRRNPQFPLHALCSEATSSALKDSLTSLASYRTISRLNRLFNLPRDATWQDIETARDAIDWEGLCRNCFERSYIQCILIDDGLNNVEGLAEDFKWHGKFTSSPAKRFVRVERLAEDIITELVSRPRVIDSAASSDFISTFNARLTAAASDPDVVGFKTIVCYRTGLDVHVPTIGQEGEESMKKCLSKYIVHCKQAACGVRLQEKVVNDWVVRKTLEIASDCHKPVQFHTGLGDADMQLRLSTPALLQPLIEAYPAAVFVLLHGSYPFMRELGWLAAMYKNVYADFGLPFLLLGANGGREMLRELLELCPTNKLMWSTDAHWWPETYYLGSIEARNGLYEVLSDCVGREELTETQAMEITEDVLFWNANRVYDLKLTPKMVSTA